MSQHSVTLSSNWHNTIPTFWNGNSTQVQICGVNWPVIGRTFPTENWTVLQRDRKCTAEPKRDSMDTPRACHGHQMDKLSQHTNYCWTQYGLAVGDMKTIHSLRSLVGRLTFVRVCVRTVIVLNSLAIHQSTRTYRGHSMDDRKFNLTFQLKPPTDYLWNLPFHELSCRNSTLTRQSCIKYYWLVDFLQE